MMIIGNRFNLHNKINSGSFGEIHLASDIKTGQKVAVKLEKIKIKSPQLQYQAKLLAYLTDQIDPRQNGLPRIHFYGKFENKYHALVMDLLGPSLQDLFQKCGKKFDLKTVVMVGIQIIDRLKFLHRKKFIHRDIKPENFLLGMNQYCGSVFMIDLGLSKKYIQKNGEHIPYRDDRALKGTPRYTSLNSHLGIEQSRRDDLESVIYMLIYFLKGRLPWQNLQQDQHFDRYEKILQKKLSVSVENLTMGLPKQFKQLVEYTRNLHFIEDPNYEYIKGLLEQAALQENIEIAKNDLYCWEKQETYEKGSQKNVQQNLSSQHALSKQSSQKIKHAIHDSSEQAAEVPINSKKGPIKSQQPSQLQPKQTSYGFDAFDSKFSGKQNSVEQNNPTNNMNEGNDSNPFDSNKKFDSDSIDPFGQFVKHKSSVNEDANSGLKSSANPFGTKTEKSSQGGNPFGSSFDDFAKPGRTDESLDQDNPFSNYQYKDPEIIQY